MKTPWLPAALLALASAALAAGYSHVSRGGSQQQSLLYTASYDVSPDSKQIVFAGKGNGGSDLYLFNLVTHQVTRLTDTPGYENDPAFSPDGKSIVYQYAENLASPRYLFLRSLDGNHVRQLTQGTVTADSSPSFSWSGEKIVFCRSHKFLNNDAGANNWDQQDVYTINRNGSGLLRLTRGNYELMIRPHFYPGDDAVLFEVLHSNNNPYAFGMWGGLSSRAKETWDFAFGVKSWHEVRFCSVGCTTHVPGTSLSSGVCPSPAPTSASRSFVCQRLHARTACRHVGSAS